MKIIYEPKEFILDKDLNEQENEFQFGRYLNQYHKQKEDQLNKMNQKRKEEKKLNSNLNLKSKKDNKEFTSSSLNNTLSPKSPLSPRSRKSPRSPGNNLSYTKSRESISSLKKAKIRKMEEEKRDLEKKKKEFLNFIEDAHRKEKAIFAKKVYNKSLNMEKTDIDNVIKDYNKQQNKIKEDKIIKTNLLHLDNVGNVVRDPEVNFNKFNMKYEPKEYLDK